MVASTTVVTNLNADLLDGNEASAFITSLAGVLLADGTVPLTAAWDAGNFDITADEFIADTGFKGPQIGPVADADLLGLTSGKLTVNGFLTTTDSIETQFTGTGGSGSAKFTGVYAGATATRGVVIEGKQSRGTVALPTVSVSGDRLMYSTGLAYDGNSYGNATSIFHFVEGTIADTRTPGRIEFWTATDATPSVLTKRTTIDSAGTLMHLYNGVFSGSLACNGLTVSHATLPVITVARVDAAAITLGEVIGEYAFYGVDNHVNTTGQVARIDVVAEAAWADNSAKSASPHMPR